MSVDRDRELLHDADNCLHGILWMIDTGAARCENDRAADVLAATRTLKWLGQRHNEYLDRAEGREDLRATSFAGD